ncbi:MAG TPA: PAS domain-containing protein, partial [Gemmatimonadaceae bacterium]|nr:PAS domain-containing protein [Gemmatimonadaceae bacterium]
MPIGHVQDAGLDAVFESAAVGLLVVSNEGTILRVNNAFASMLEMDANDVAGQSVIDITFPADHSETRKVMDDLSSRRSRHVDIRKRYLKSDGTPLWVHATVVAAHDSYDSTHYLVTVRDLTETRDLTDRLHDASTRYRRLVDANVLGV